MTSSEALLLHRAHASKLGARLGVLACLPLLLLGQAHAQPAADAPEPAAPPQIPARADQSEAPGGMQAPRVVKLQPVELPPQERAAYGDTLELVVLIDSEGHAQLEDAPHDPAAPQGEPPSEHSPAVKAAIATALARSELHPALRNGVPVPARVRLTLAIVRIPAARTGATTSATTGATTPDEASLEAAARPLATATPEPVAQAAAPEPEASFGATGRVSLAAPTELRLLPSETRDVPGAFGDPFRVLDTLPGVVPAISGVPYVYVRGAPPAGTNYYYDEIQVPALFHLALGPAVVHPAMIGTVDFYPSVAPTRFGRYTGGVLAGGYPARSPPSAASGELELRLIDINGMLQAKLGKGSITLAGRYGYPGLILSVFSPDALLSYWDYQARIDLPLNDSDRFQLTWFGSFDRAGEKNEDAADSTITLEFHRLEARLLRDVGRLQLGSALQLGYDRSQIDEGLQASSVRIGPRVYAQYRDAGVRVRAGMDFMGIAGQLDAPLDQDGATLGISTPLYEDVAGRSMLGAYAELRAPLHPRLILDAGVRSDLWLTGSRGELAADPRATLTFHSHDAVAWHVAGGLAHQPAVFLIPLPGIADVGIDRGLQRAVQSEAGVTIDLPGALRAESQVYLQRFTDMIFPDLAIDQDDDCASIPPDVAVMTERCSGGYPRASAWAYGVEALLRRRTSEALSGWLSYTMGFARARSEEGYAFTPSFDVRHVANLVLQYRLGGGVTAGARLHYRTGKVASATFVRERLIRYEQRLPGFFRADAQLSYGWSPQWGRMRVSLEWFNATLSREPTDIECRDGIDVGSDPLRATPCPVTYAPAIFFPNLGLRAEF